MDACPKAPRPKGLAAAASGAGDLSSALGSAKTKGPCRLDKSPHPATALETNIVAKTPAPTVMLSAREIVFMKFLFLPRVLRVHSPRRKAEGKTWIGTAKFQRRRRD